MKNIYLGWIENLFPEVVSWSDRRKQSKCVERRMEPSDHDELLLCKMMR